jgi:transposase
MKVKQMPITQVARTLNLSRSSLYRWLDNPSLKEKPRKGKPASFTRIAELKTMLLKNSSLTGRELAEHFNVSSDVIDYHLKELGFIYKKKIYSYKESCAQKKDFLDHLSEHIESNVYYLDESGFDIRHEQTCGWRPSFERLEGLKTGVWGYDTAKSP